MSDVIVHVSRPELTHKERERRMSAIRAAAMQLLVAAEKSRKDDRSV
jgi:hypothetical protein